MFRSGLVQVQPIGKQYYKQSYLGLYNIQSPFFLMLYSYRLYQSSGYGDLGKLYSCLYFYFNWFIYIYCFLMPLETISSLTARGSLQAHTIDGLPGLSTMERLLRTQNLQS